MLPPHSPPDGSVARWFSRPMVQSTDGSVTPGRVVNIATLCPRTTEQVEAEPFHVRDSLGGIVFDPRRGSRNVATGGVSRYSGRRNPWSPFVQQSPAPKGAEERRNLRFPAPRRGGTILLHRPPRVPLRPPNGGLRSTRGYIPRPLPGSNANRRKCHGRCRGCPESLTVRGVGL